MNNSTHYSNYTMVPIVLGENTTNNQTITIIYLSIQLMALSLQLAVQYTIQKARLTDNQYQLVLLLSMIESTYLVTVIIFSVFLLAGNDRHPYHNKHFLKFMTFLAYTWKSLSVIINVLISVDRWIAVKYCLRYQALVTKKKLGGAFLSVALVNAIILLCMFYIGETTNTIVSHKGIFTSRVIMAYAASLRMIACHIMIILGKKTIRYRNESEERIRKMNNLHGSQAEQLDLLTVLRRGTGCPRNKLRSLN